MTFRLFLVQVLDRSPDNPIPTLVTALFPDELTRNAFARSATLRLLRMTTMLVIVVTVAEAP